MKRQSIEDTLTKQKEILESQGYTVAFIGLYGSQNYFLDVYTDDYQSDIDMKAIIVPTLDDLVSNSKPASTTVDTEWGQCDVKDIRQFFQTLLKANPAYLEVLFTEYYLIDKRFIGEFVEILKNRDKLVYTLRAQMVRAIYGMMCEKEKALTHPYPSIAHKIEEFGYCGKQLSHIIRLFNFMRDYYLYNQTMDEALIATEDRELIIKTKLNIPTLEEARELAKEYMAKGKELRDIILNEIDEVRLDYSIKDEFLQLSQSIIKNKITLEIEGETT